MSEVTDELVAREVMGLVPRYWTIHPFTTDIASAWQVVERMEALGYQWIADRWEEGPIGWTFDKCVDGRLSSGHGHADSAPAAICAAALAAVRADRGE